jgi:hypothetical protein
MGGAFGRLIADLRRSVSGPAAAGCIDSVTAGRSALHVDARLIAAISGAANGSRAETDRSAGATAERRSGARLSL